MNTTKFINNDELRENIENWGLSVNARNRFYNFIDAVEKNEKGLISECQKIYQIIDDIILTKEKKQFEQDLDVGTICYRARIIDPKDDQDTDLGIGKTSDGKFIGYNEVNSREPIIGIPGEGRNNVAGASYLYVASNPETACMEIKSQLGDLISLATFVVKEKLKIIDFSSEKVFNRIDTQFHEMSLGVFFSLLMLRYCEPVEGDNGYYATQLISDYLRKTGIDGIAYKSFLSPGGINYTFFNSHPQKIGFEGSRVLIHKQANHSFWDFNEEKAILSNKEEKMIAYDTKIAEEHRKHLNQRFKMIKQDM